MNSAIPFFFLAFSTWKSLLSYTSLHLLGTAKILAGKAPQITVLDLLRADECSLLVFY